MLMALNSLEVVKTNPTIETAKQITQFLNYSATHLDTITEYRKEELFSTYTSMHTTYQNRRHEVDPEDIFPRTKIQHTNSIDVSRKWTSACRMTHNEKCNVISHGSRTWSVIFKLPERKFYEYSPKRDGPPTTTNNGGNRQYSNKQHIQRNGKAKNVLSNWHEILLGQR